MATPASWRFSRLFKPFAGPEKSCPSGDGTGDTQYTTSSTVESFVAAALGLPGIYPASDGTGPRNFLHGLPSFGNDLSLIKNFTVQGGRGLELRANFYNIFNNVRRITVNNGITYKAKGTTFAEGFDIINTPEASLERSKASGVTDPLQLYNQFRTGAGHVTVTTVSPMRIVEIGLALRF